MNRLFTLAALLGLLFFATGCGDDNDKPSEKAPPSQEESAIQLNKCLKKENAALPLNRRPSQAELETFQAALEGPCKRSRPNSANKPWYISLVCGDEDSILKRASKREDHLMPQLLVPRKPLLPARRNGRPHRVSEPLALFVGIGRNLCILNKR
jgi:hypothetical protein